MKKIPVSEPCLAGNELKYLTDCVKTGWISSIGRYVTRFEEMFAGFCGRKYALATSNGTASLHLALEALGIKPGDEVLVPCLTFAATANVVSYVNARPVFVDISPETWTIDAKLIESRITKRTKAVIPVHLYGHPADMAGISALCRKHGLKLVEDAAQAHGAKVNGKNVGCFGDFSSFSFYGNKIITTGEGGMLLTDSKKLYEKARLLRNHGMSDKRKYWHPVIGYNYRMTNLQAAVGVAQMERIGAVLRRKREIAALYSKLLDGIPGIVRPATAAWAYNVYWMYSVLVAGQYRMSADKLRGRLAGEGIETRPFFTPLHRLPCYKTAERFPVSEKVAQEGINLPSSPLLKDHEIKRIAGIIRDNYCGEIKK